MSSYSYTLDDGVGAQFGNVLGIISDASVELGLGSVSDAYGSTEANVVMLRRLLTGLGRKLAKRRHWRALVKEHTLTTEAGVSEYALPADFLAMVNGAGWNRSNDRRLWPADAEVWQLLQAEDAVGLTLSAIFRPRADVLELWPQPPTAGDVIAFEYRSRYWVQSSGAASADKDAPTANTDTALLDPEMIIQGLCLEWRKRKGFDTLQAQQEFDELYGLASSVDTSPAPVLRLDGRSVYSGRLIDGSNVPDTGYGG